MPVADDEEIVAARRDDGADECEGLGAHVLCFVHDDGDVIAAATVFNEKRGSVPVGIVHFLQSAFGQLCSVLFEYRPHLDTRASAETRAPPNPGHLAVLLLARHPAGLDDLLPLVFIEGIGESQLRWFAIECPLPRLSIPSVLRLELVASPPKKPCHPPVQVLHFNAAHLFRGTDAAKVVLDVRGEVAGKSGEENPPRRKVPREPAGTVHRSHCLSGARSAERAHRSVPVTLHEAALRGVKEHAPVLEGRVQHRFEREVVLDDDEPRSGFRPFQSRGKVFRIHLRRCLSFRDELFVRVAGQVEVQRVVGLNGKAVLHPIESRLIEDLANFRGHGWRHCEPGKLTVLEVGKCGPPYGVVASGG